VNSKKGAVLLACLFVVSIFSAQVALHLERSVRQACPAMPDVAAFAWMTALSGGAIGVFTYAALYKAVDWASKRHKNR
jgi:hypothetical protein